MSSVGSSAARNSALDNDVVDEAGVNIELLGASALLDLSAPESKRFWVSALALKLIRSSLTALRDFSGHLP